jgi:hypothetical protein
VDALVAQVEEAVAEPQLLGRLGVGVHGERQRLGGAQNLDLAHGDLDGARRELGVHGVGRAGLHRAADRDHRLGPQTLDELEDGARHVDDALGDAVVVAQVDEEELTVIALSMHPPGEPHRLPGVRLAQLAAGVAAVMGCRHPG